MKFIKACWIIIILGLVNPVNAEVSPAVVPQLEAEKKIVRITPSGLVPSTIHLTKLDGSVFFFNESGGSSVDLSIRFGKNRLHCHSPRMKLNADGNLVTTSPLIPNSFVIACFPDRDRYEVEVRGVQGVSRSLQGMVIVD